MLASQQWQGKAEAASDQYSLGCLFFELLTGKKPYSGGSPGHYLYLHTHQAAPSPRKLNGLVPHDLETVCLKCLDKEPAKRYADCRTLAEDLARWQRGEPVTARRVSWAERCLRWSKRNPLAAGLAAAFLGTLLLGIGAATGLALWALAEAGLKEKEASNAKRAEDQAKKDAEAARTAGIAAENAAEQARMDRDRAEDEKKKFTTKGLINKKVYHQGRKRADSLLEFQVNEVPQRVTEIQRNPFQPSVDIPNHLGDFHESPAGTGPG